MMETKINLKEIEQKTFRESNQDGLLELVMDICMAAISTRLIPWGLVTFIRFLRKYSRLSEEV